MVRVAALMACISDDVTPHKRSVLGLLAGELDPDAVDAALLAAASLVGDGS